MTKEVKADNYINITKGLITRFISCGYVTQNCNDIIEYFFNLRCGLIVILMRSQSL